MPSIDLNCDLGESFGAYTIGMDAEILPYVTSANIACGFHAGDPSVMQKSVLLCKKYGVQVGAHPGLPDLQGFGRRRMAISPAEAEADVMYQIGALKAFCDAAGVPLHHVKPHGALYNMAAKDPALAAAMAGLLLNVLAPGTQVRTAGFAGAGFAEAVVKSFILAAMEWIRWLDVPLLCLLALLVLPLLHLTRSAVLSDRVFRHPWLGAAVTFVLMWAMIFLPSYTMGGIGAGRLLNVVWMTFVLGLAVTEFLLLGWLERVRGVSLHGAEQFCRRQARRLPLLAAAMLLCMACIGSHTVKEGQDSYFATSLEAAYELVNGSARRYADALDAREALLNDAAQPDVSIRPLNDDERPWLLFYTDVAPGPDMWGLTPYFGKQSVTISDFE